MNQTKSIRLFRWALILPIMQLLIAIALWVYEPFEFHRVIIHEANAFRAMHNMPALKLPSEESHPDVQIRSLYYPPLAGRVRQVINLPARLLSDFLRAQVRTSPALGITWPLGDDPWYPRDGTTVYYFGLQEAAFFAGVVLLWLYIGIKIDRFIRNRQFVTRRIFLPSLIFELVIALLLALWLLLDCLRVIKGDQCCPPERQIAFFGLVWPLALLVYVILVLRNLFRVRKASSISF
jgi:hypothetical protein